MSTEPAQPESSLPSALADSWVDHLAGIDAIGDAIMRSGWKPTAILGIARGGLIPAAILAYKLDVRLILSVRVQHYAGQELRLESGAQFIDESRPFEGLNTERLLIVDDIIDTGETIKLVRRAVREYAKEVKVAALYIRSAQKNFVDWYWKVEDEWVTFPWAPKG